MGLKWIRMVVLCIKSDGGEGGCWDTVVENVDLWCFRGASFRLASPRWVLSGTTLCFVGAYGSGVTHLLNMLEFGVGMGLMSSIFACNVREKVISCILLVWLLFLCWLWWLHWLCWCRRPVLLSIWMMSKDDCSRLFAVMNCLYVSLCSW